MNKSLIFVFCEGFLLQAAVSDTYKVEYENDTYYELKDMWIEFVVLKDSYIQGKIDIGLLRSLDRLSLFSGYN